MIPVEEELDWILEAYGERYQAGNLEIVTQFIFPAHSGFTIQAADLMYYLNKLQPRESCSSRHGPSYLMEIMLGSF